MLTACSKESSSKKTTPNDDVIEQKIPLPTGKSNDPSNNNDIEDEPATETPINNENPTDDVTKTSDTEQEPEIIDDKEEVLNDITEIDFANNIYINRQLYMYVTLFLQPYRLLQQIKM